MTSTSTALQQQMVQLVRHSIEQGLQQGRPATMPLNQLPMALQQPGACFVTLELHNQLRGCIGSLEAHRPLAEDLLSNGYAAAFRDPRFPPLTRSEYQQIAIKISLLSTPEPMQFKSEAELIRQLLPGVDGLILQEGAQRGTFLPSVWEQLPDPHDFLNRLKQKAGLAPTHWSDQIRIERYRTEQFS
ncbi:MAG: AmmeMemoRadiSam system protein A [Gammaproteobacteria bacterium]|jgi:uncharacterized protein|nr:AmmeMemoRadiSam system protein A [Gammaproteobacteria bacterium]MBT7307618.1 AmmeMemoRadiSam system protein A [Gammaproteobacteria bacterium]